MFQFNVDDMNEEKKVSTDGVKFHISVRAPVFWLSLYGVGWALVLTKYIFFIEENYTRASSINYISDISYIWPIAMFFFIIPGGIVMELMILLPIVFLYMKRRWSWTLAIILLKVRLIIEVVFVMLILFGFKDVFFALLFFGLGIVLLRSLKMVIQYRDIYSEMLR